MITATFAMEQHIGHRTYFLNLFPHIERNSSIQAQWIPVTYEEPGGMIERLPLLSSHLRGTLRGIDQVRRGLSKQSGDVVVFNTQVPALLAGRRQVTRKPYVLATDITPAQYNRLAALYGHSVSRFGLVERFKHRRNQHCIAGAARLLPWSSWVAQSFIDDYGVAPDKIEVIPPGIDLSLWQPKFDKADDRFHILFVGGDFELKQGQVLLDVFRQLPKKRFHLHLVTRTALAAEEGVTVYNGMEPNSAELIALFHQAHAFVLPTRVEAFGIAAIEASAMGLPVIATKIGGLTDIVDDGITGFLIDSGDKDKITSHLLTLANDPALRSKMGYAARKRVEQRFDARKNAARMVQVLDEIVQQQLAA